MIATWLKGSVLLAATLATGIAIGIGIGAERAREHHGEGHASPEMQMLHSHLMQTLGSLLDLDSSQHKAIMETLHRHQSHVDSAWESMRPHISATLDSTHQEIMGILRPEQRETFMRMIADSQHVTSHKPRT
jgi:hypothetical protein